jgi:uncharacterized protein YaaR (DUF327 family)
LLKRRLYQNPDSENLIAYNEVIRTYRKEALEYISKNKESKKQSRTVALLSDILKLNY